MYVNKLTAIFKIWNYQFKFIYWVCLMPFNYLIYKQFSKIKFLYILRNLNFKFNYNYDLIAFPTNFKKNSTFIKNYNSSVYTNSSAILLC